MRARETSDPRSDELLVEAVNRGDAAAFEELYRRYRDWVVNLAHRYTQNEHDALDVLQETFTYFLGKFPGFRLEARLTTFLFPAVKHLALTARKKRGRLTGGNEAVDGVPAPPGRNEAAEREELAAVLGGLPDSRREVLLLRFVDGFSLREIARALEIPIGTVKSRLHNALDTLREDPRTRSYFGE